MKYCRHTWVLAPKDFKGLEGFYEFVICSKCGKAKNRLGPKTKELENDCNHIMYGCGYGTFKKLLRR
jgi:hypothetical protein